ncbi:MAG: phosphoribosylamine--glycine ligase N-terminal domain-containing protein [Verrucomicrobiota bacterium]
MKILLIGSGGREHALAWRLRQDDPAVELFTAPGNAGTAALGTNLPISATDLDALVAWAVREKPRPDHRRARGAAVRRRGGPLRAGGPRHLRPERGRGAAGGQQGLHQGTAAAPRSADRGGGALLHRLAVRLRLQPEAQ